MSGAWSYDGYEPGSTNHVTNATSATSETGTRSRSSKGNGSNAVQRDRQSTDPSSLVPGTDTTDYLAGMRNGAWLDKQDLPALEWAVPGLIPEGLTLFVGPPKAGKSWVITACLLAIAAGGRALGKVPTGAERSVLNLAFEDGDRRQQSRCRALMEGAPIPERYAYLTKLTRAGAVLPTIRQYLDATENPGLIAVDTLGKVMPDSRMGETSYSRDYRVSGALKDAADSRPGLAVVAVHHDRKAVTEDFVESVSGTNGLAGAADTIIVLNRKRQSAEAVLQVTGRDVDEAEYAIKRVGGIWVLDGADLSAAARAARVRREAGEMGEGIRSILTWAENERPEGFSFSDCVAANGENARANLQRLVEAGRLDKPKRGWYTLPLTEGTGA